MQELYQEVAMHWRYPRVYSQHTMLLMRLRRNWNDHYLLIMAQIPST